MPMQFVKKMPFSFQDCQHWSFVFDINIHGVGLVVIADINHVT
jgi:hypothetical protein